MSWVLIKARRALASAQCRTACTVLVVAALASSTVYGDLLIHLEYQEDSSQPPPVDPGGHELQSIMGDAVDYWERMFPFIDKEITVRFYWDDISDAGGFLGLGACQSQLALTDRPYGAVVAANIFRIRFDTDDCIGKIRWYIDDSPWEHSEFQMRTLIFQDGGSAGFFNGTPNNFFQVGYTGNGYQQTIAAVSFDLFSTALHELGHALGLGYLNEGDVNGGLGTGDGDYDPAATLPGGGIGILAATTMTGRWDVGHLAATSTLMAQILPIGNRFLPTATDVLALAAANGWTTDIELPNKYIHGAGNLVWHDADWYDDLPGFRHGAMIDDPLITEVLLEDDVIVHEVHLAHLAVLDVDDRLLIAGTVCMVDGTSLLIGANGAVTAYSGIETEGVNDQLIEISGGAELRTFDYLIARGNTVVHAAGGPGSPAVIRVGGPNVGRGITLRNAPVPPPAPAARMEVSSADILANRLIVDASDSEIAGGDAVFQVHELSNDGRIVSNNGDLLFVPYGPNTTFDLDGDETMIGPDGSVLPDERGEIEALGGNIHFEYDFADEFDGLIRIHGIRTVGVSGELVMGPESVLEFLGDEAILQAAPVVLGGAMVADSGGSMDARIQGGQHWLASGSTFIGDGARLHLAGPSTFEGVNLLDGLGTVIQVGDATYAGDNFFQVASYRWDGERPSMPGVFSDSELLPDSSLSIFGTIQLGPLGTDGYDGTVTIRAGATLHLDQAWILDGTLVLDGGTVTGAPITNRGLITGIGVIAADVINAPAGTIEWGGLTFAGAVSCGGGTWLPEPDPWCP